MKTSHIVIAAFMLWSAGFANICLAQVSAMGVPSASADSTQTQTEFLLVQHKNGQWFYGQVIGRNAYYPTLTLDTESHGIKVFHKRQIIRTVLGPISADERQRITGYEGPKSKRSRSSMKWRRIFETPNPQPGRYFSAPSAFQLKKGEANFRTSFYHDGNRVLLNNELGVGVTNRLTAGTNAILPLGWGVAAKYGVELIPHVHVAAGGGILLPFRDWREERLGYLRTPIFPWRNDKYGSTALVFASMTLGSANRNFTFNWFTSQSAGFDFNVFNVSALLPITESTWLITEQYVADWPGYVFQSLGLRMFNKRWKFMWDFAVDRHKYAWGWTQPHFFLSTTIPIKHWPKRDERM